MNTYDYKTVPFRDLEKPHYGQLDIEKLNELGMEGWELVCIVSGECVFKKLVKRRIVNKL